MEKIFESLKITNKPFTYRQGLDERLLTEEKSIALSECKWIGNIIFAFDDIKEKDIIIEKMKLYKKYNSKQAKFYVFCGYDREGKWDNNFWKKDIIDVFERLKILMEHKSIPYLTRFNRYIESQYAGTYINLSRWCNQPNIFKKKSYREFCMTIQEQTKTKECAPMKYLREIEKDFPGISREYFDIKYMNY